MLVIELAAGISIAPGDENRDLCQELRSRGAIPIPGYAPNMRVLMDSWNYQNLLPKRTGAVWDQVDNDTRNNASITTNVSLMKYYYYSQLCKIIEHNNIIPYTF